MSKQVELRNAVWQACTAIRNEHRDVKKYVEYTAILLFFKFYDDLHDTLPPDVKGLIPESYRWHTLKKLDPRGFAGYHPEVLQRLRDFFQAKRWREARASASFGVIFENFNFDIKHGEVLGRALISLDRIDFRGIDYDQKGDIYEFLIGKMGEAGLAGEFFTPRPVVNMIVRHLAPGAKARVWDPACGTGGFLSRAFEEMRRDLERTAGGDVAAFNEGLRRLRYSSIYGNETEAVSARLARMNMILRGDGHSTILEFNSLDRQTYRDNALEIRGDVVANPLPEVLADGGFDIIMANPPYGGTQAVSDLAGSFRPWHKSKKPESNFLQIMMHALRPGGRCGVVLPEGILFRRDDAKSRARLLRDFQLEAVVGLYKGVFEFADVKTCVLFFRRPLPVERWRGTKHVWVAEATSFEDVNRIPDALRDNETSALGRPVTLEEIVAAQGVLRPSKFLRLRADVHVGLSVGDLYEEVSETVAVRDDIKYARVRVQYHGRGATLRDVVPGEAIKTKRQKVSSTGDLVVSKIDARNGSLALIPKELNGAIVSSDFPLFRLTSSRLSPELFEFYLRYGPYARLLEVASQGTTNRQRVTAEDVLALPVPCPGEEDQQRLLKRLRTQRRLALRSEVLLSHVSRLDWLDDVIFDVGPDRVMGRSLDEFIEDASTFVEPHNRLDLEWPMYGVSNEDGVELSGKRLGSDFPPGARAKLLAPDVLVYNPMRVNVGSVGICSQLSENAITSPDYVTFRCIGKLRPDFALILLKSPYFRSIIASAEVGAVRPRLYLSTLRGIELPVPDPAAQEKIVQTVKRQLAAYSEVRQLGDLALESMRGIVGTLFSGIGVREHVADGDPVGENG